MMGLVAVLAAWAGLAALALSMRRHYRDLFRSEPSRRGALVLGSAGWALLSFSFAVCTATDGWGLGSVLWLGSLTLGHLGVALLLSLQRTPT